MHDQPLNQVTKQAIEFYEKNYVYMIEPLFLCPSVGHDLGPKFNRICRFCGKDETETKFKHTAHAIPEFLGNKSLYSNYECDDCNQFFGTGIENDLGNWTKHSRALSKIKGKRGVPSLKNFGPEQKWRIDCVNDVTFITYYEGKPPYDIDIENQQIKFELPQDVFTPVAVMKAFVKIGLTILPQVEIPNFKETLSWIREPDHNQPFVDEFPIIRTFQPGPMRSDLLVVMIMRRRESIENLPYAFLVLGFGNDVYQVFIPCPQRDRTIHGKKLTIPPFPTPGRLDPTKHSPRTILVDLCGRLPVRGSTVTRTCGYDYMEDGE